jgi:hypothetical protein
MKTVSVSELKHEHGDIVRNRILRVAERLT